MSKPYVRTNSHAVVIGGSMAGLLAARVLSDHFGTVTVLERDRYPAAVTPRSGVPQAHHVHALLMRGLGTVERLFPGIRDELVRHGATPLDSARDFEWLTPGGWAPRFESRMPFLSMSRPLIDRVVLGRVAALPNVTVREDVAVDGFSMDHGRERVKGVVLRGGEHVPAGLVVDATGRRSQASHWLAAFGYTPPPEVVVDGHLGYASRIYRRTPGAQSRWKATYSQAAPPRVNRTGLAFPIEGGRWIVTVAGGGGDYPPTDEAGFIEFARSLPNPSVYEVIRNSEPLTGIRGYRGIENRMRRWDRVPLPKGFVAVGDAACAFNPVYGQGMSTAAIGAELLDKCICGGDLQSFQRRLTKSLGVAWMLATSEDVRYPGAEGGKTGLGTRIMHRYLDRVIALSVRSIETRRDLLGVFHLVQAPQILFRPRTLIQALRGAGTQPATPRRAERPLPFDAPGRGQVDGVQHQLEGAEGLPSELRAETV